MRNNLRVESTTDSELDQSYAEVLQPYNAVSVTVTTARPSVQREDGSIEHAPEDVQNLSAVVPGRELQENMRAYSKRLEDYKRDHPEFGRYADPETPLPLSVRDEILRMHNAPEIVEFLGFCPNVCEALCQLDPLEAARKVQEMSDDLSWGRLPDDRVDYPAWRDGRNRAEFRRSGMASKKGKQSWPKTNR
jgi:hypothetical protein